MYSQYFGWIASAITNNVIEVISCYQQPRLCWTLPEFIILLAKICNRTLLKIHLTWKRQTTAVLCKRFECLVEVLRKLPTYIFDLKKLFKIKVTEEYAYIYWVDICACIV